MVLIPCSLIFKGQTFTFDHVFGMELTQNELYERTAAPMLKNFLEGYNCTIMAYGQTGSGKTFTMGTADHACNDPDAQGLIPRFVMDLFENLNNPLNKEEETSYKIKVSFLEIYGEDVFDLLSSSSSRQNDVASRTSLPVREDETGRVFVQGQTDIEVKGPTGTLEVLAMGSHNRVTASTAMNAGSSRSHAVFTILLEQTVKSSGSDDDVHCMSSKLTFVDLAGSERIKRTGAEGQRMKEGIQINSGLFNLGQVINSLADEQKLKSGAKTFVPYRNSKLTHLLKDALGGNSQTLFLACVSPADSNDNETYSTLNVSFTTLIW
jgi:kinesin family protein 4/21/27